MYALGARCGTAAPLPVVCCLPACLPPRYLRSRKCSPRYRYLFFAAGLLRIQGVGTFFFSLLACSENKTLCLLHNNSGIEHAEAGVCFRFSPSTYAPVPSVPPGP